VVVTGGGGTVAGGLVTGGEVAGGAVTGGAATGVEGAAAVPPEEAALLELPDTVAGDAPAPAPGDPPDPPDPE